MTPGSVWGVLESDHRYWVKNYREHCNFADKTLTQNVFLSGFLKEIMENTACKKFTITLYSKAEYSMYYVALTGSLLYTWLD